MQDRPIYELPPCFEKQRDERLLLEQQKREKENKEYLDRIEARIKIYRQMLETQALIHTHPNYRPNKRLPLLSEIKSDFHITRYRKLPDPDERYAESALEAEANMTYFLSCSGSIFKPSNDFYNNFIFYIHFKVNEKCHIQMLQIDLYRIEPIYYRCTYSRCNQEYDTLQELLDTELGFCEFEQEFIFKENEKEVSKWEKMTPRAILIMDTNRPKKTDQQTSVSLEEEKKPTPSAESGETTKELFAKLNISTSQDNGKTSPKPGPKTMAQTQKTTAQQDQDQDSEREARRLQMIKGWVKAAMGSEVGPKEEPGFTYDLRSGYPVRIG